MKSLNRYIAAVQIYAVIAVLMIATAKAADDDEIARGKYLVEIATCGDCHTPLASTGDPGAPDPERLLAGSDTAIEQPGQGAFVGGNITPDQETGIGRWSPEQIVTTLQTGYRPDGTPLQPHIHSKGYTAFTKEDLMAIAAYLKSIPAVKNQVHGPFSPGDKVTTYFLIRRLPPGETVQQ
jgi:mono/diheme cytochrome c family protein